MVTSCSAPFTIENLPLAVETEGKILDKIIHVYFKIRVRGDITILKLGHGDK